MAKHPTAYIDIGTLSTRVALLERDNEGSVSLVGTGITPSKGVRYGYITNQADASRSIEKALSTAIKSGGIKANHAVIGLCGKGLESVIATGTAIVSKSDQEVTTFDMEKAISEAEGTVNLQNKKIIFQSPILYKIDGKEVLGRPEKTKGIKLEVKMLFVTYFTQQLNDAVEATSTAGLEVIDVVPSLLGSANIVLTETQKTAGVILVDIGADTTSCIVYENNVPLYLTVIPFGGNHITNDIALGLRIPLDEAEKIKLGGDHTFSNKKLHDIIEARLSEIFEILDKQLRKLGRSGMLPAGVVLIGNGSLHPLTKTIAEKTLSIPAKICLLDSAVNIKFKIKDHGWFPVIGLPFTSTAQKNTVNSVWSEIKKMFKNTISQLTP